MESVLHGSKEVKTLTATSFMRLSSNILSIAANGNACEIQLIKTRTLRYVVMGIRELREWIFPCYDVAMS